MGKTLCDLKDLLKHDPKAYSKLISKPTHMCKKCGRVANSKKLLCKSKRLKKKK